MVSIRPLYRPVLICMLSAGLLAGVLVAGNAGAEDSSCVVCHTDEDLLLENLAPAAEKKSALQAGAG